MKFFSPVNIVDAMKWNILYIFKELSGGFLVKTNTYFDGTVYYMGFERLKVNWELCSSIDDSRSDLVVEMRFKHPSDQFKISIAVY